MLSISNWGNEDLICFKVLFLVVKYKEGKNYENSISYEIFEIYLLEFIIICLNLK